MKRLLYTLLGMSLMVAGTVFALPYFTSQKTLIPTDSNQDLGTTTTQTGQGTTWRNLYLQGTDGCLTLTSNLVTPSGVACGSGSGGGSGGGTWGTTTSSVSGRLINYPLNVTDIVVIGGTATSTGATEYWFDPNTQNAHIGSSNTASTTIMGNATTTGSHALGALILNSQYFTSLLGSGLLNTSNALTCATADTSTFGCVTAAKFSQFNSATTTFTSPLVYTAGTNAVTLTTSGTWSGNAGTATALAANGGNCSSGSAPLGVDTLGASENCFDVWTEAENTTAAYVQGTRTLTVAGTGNQITSSAGAQDLSANRTWTLSFPNQVIFPQYASTTNGFSTPYASSTSLFVGTLTLPSIQTCNTTSALTTTAGVVGCGSITGSGGGIGDPFTHPAAGQSATTSLMLLNGNASTTGLSAGYAFIGSTATTTITPAGYVGIGTSTPYGNLSIHAPSQTNPYFAIGSSSAQVFSISPTTGSDSARLTLSTTTAGCLNINNVGLLFSATCAGGGSVTSVIAGAGFQNQGLNITSSGTFVVGIATSTTPVIGNLAMWTQVGDVSTPARLGIVATSTVSFTSPLSGTSFNVLGSGGGAITCPTCMTSYDAFTHPQLGFSATTSSMAIGTSTTATNVATLTTSSSTASQLGLFAGTGIAGWALRNAGGNLYLATTTVDGLATSSNPAPFTFQGSNGFFGIGTTTPWASLSINAPSQSAPLFAIGSSSGTLVSVTAANYAQYGLGTSTPYGTLAVQTPAGFNGDQFNVGSSSKSAFRIDGASHVFIPNITTATAGSNQTVCFKAATGELIDETTTACAVSSAQFKGNIKDLRINSIDMILALNPVSYSYKENVSYDYHNTLYGFIAEEVAQVDPHLAEYGVDGKPRTLDDRGILALVVDALQKLIAKVTGLEKKVNDQQKQIDELRAEINNLKK